MRFGALFVRLDRLLDCRRLFGRRRGSLGGRILVLFRMHQLGFLAGLNVFRRHGRLGFRVVFLLLENLLVVGYVSRIGHNTHCIAARTWRSRFYFSTRYLPTASCE